jgi:hypothetical protein
LICCCCCCCIEKWMSPYSVWTISRSETANPTGSRTPAPLSFNPQPFAIPSALSRFHNIT